MLNNNHKVWKTERGGPKMEGDTPNLTGQETAPLVKRPQRKDNT